MDVKQISVFLENKPGTLNSMTGVLADNKIDMKALSLAETKDFGIARMIVDDVFETVTVLKDAGFICSMTPVVAARIPDEPGGLHKILEIFTEAEVNVDYMYAFLGANISDAYMIFRVQDTAVASKVLSAKGITVVGQDELSDL